MENLREPAKIDGGDEDEDEMGGDTGAPKSHEYEGQSVLYEKHRPSAPGHREGLATLDRSISSCPSSQVRGRTQRGDRQRRVQARERTNHGAILVR